MKFAFSTLGCPDWDWNDIISTARDMGYDGIELRGITSDMYLPHHKIFSDEQRPLTLSQLEKLKLEIPCLTSGAFLFDGSKMAQAQQEVKDYICLANSLHVPYIRVLGDANPEPGPINETAIEENLRILLPLAAKNKTILLLESNGFYAKSARLKRLLEKVNHPALGVLWDIHHPYRFYGEPVAETYSTLKPWIKHVHIKDSVMLEGQIKYRLLGSGDVPVVSAIKLLTQDDFPGYISLEWVKRWCMDLEEPGIVFSHFLNTVKHMAQR